MRIVPAVGSSRPAISRSSVVLPPPDGPTRTASSPSATCRLPSPTAPPPGGATLGIPSRATAAIRRSREMGAADGEVAEEFDRGVPGVGGVGVRPRAGGHVGAVGLAAHRRKPAAVRGPPDQDDGRVEIRRLHQVSVLAGGLHRPLALLEPERRNRLHRYPRGTLSGPYGARAYEAAAPAATRRTRRARRAKQG